MTMTQMNVRLDARLKNDVDAILREQSVSASDVIRTVWTYIADRHEIPQLETHSQEEARIEERRRRLAIVDDSAGYVQRELARAGVIDAAEDPFAVPIHDSTYRRLRDDMYEQRLDDYLNMERSDR